MTDRPRPGGALRAAVDGAAAGVVATAAMSGPMLVAHRAGWVPKPMPETIAEAAFDAAGVEPGERSERQENGAATVLHMGFGAACGAVYGLLRHRIGRRPPGALDGIAFGLAVWATSYQGWIPALGILPPASDDRRERVATEVATHIVFGAVLGRFFRRRQS